MIYTMGVTIDIERRYFNDPDHPRREGGKDTAVWQTAEAVENYINSLHPARHWPPPRTLGIYAIDADWDADTEVVEHMAWRILKRTAMIYRLNEIPE